MSDTESNSPKIARARSKSAVTLSRGVVKVSEIVPAVPPRRASLGILHRANSNLNKSAGKCGLKALKESDSTSCSPLSQSEKFKLKNDENGGINIKLSESEENLDERTYMVLEPEPDHEYALNKSKFFVSAEKEDESKPAVRMTMRERLKQLTQSSEDEIDHTSDSDVSPAVDKQKSELVNELAKSLEDPRQNNDTKIGQQQVVTVKFSADNGMLSAEGAQVTTTGKPLGDHERDSTNEANNDSKASQAGKEPRFQLKPGTDAQGYTKLLHVDERDKDERGSDGSLSAPGSTFISYFPLDSSRSTLDTDSGISSVPTPPVRRSWVSANIDSQNIVNVFPVCLALSLVVCAIVGSTNIRRKLLTDRDTT